MEKEKKIEDQIMGKIKEEKITPKPRWIFLINNYLTWISGIMFLSLGALAFSLIKYFSRQEEWEDYQHIGRGHFEFLFFAVPLILIILLAISIYLVYFNFKHTKTGYRYSILSILSIAILSNIILGFIFSFFRMDRRMDDMLGKNAPFYSEVFNPHIRFWSDPDNGRIAGMITNEIEENKFNLITKDQTEWIILTQDMQNKDQLKINYPARLIGQKISDNEFKAEEFLMMHSGQEFFNRFKKNHRQSFSKFRN